MILWSMYCCIRRIFWWFFSISDTRLVFSSLLSLMFCIQSSIVTLCGLVLMGKFEDKHMFNLRSYNANSREIQLLMLIFFKNYMSHWTINIIMLKCKVHFTFKLKTIHYSQFFGLRIFQIVFKAYENKIKYIFDHSKIDFVWIWIENKNQRCPFLPWDI